MSDADRTGWFVYRCEVHHRTSYVNANPRPQPSGEPAVPFEFCCDQAKVVDAVTEHEFCEALRELKVKP